jgi:hypothetical protein
MTPHRHRALVGLAAMVACAATTTWMAACSDANEAPAKDGGIDGAVTNDAGGTDADASVDPCAHAPSDPPPYLECTGLYDSLAAKALRTGVRQFRPATELWSDGALKTRWVLLPEGQTIDTTDPDEWVFPIGTKFWKEFKLQDRRIETRYYAKGDDGEWVFGLYRWSDDEQSAPLLRDGEREVLGTTYAVPDLGKCPDCHGGRDDKVLGFDWVGLGAEGAEGITLESLTAEKRFSTPLPQTKVTLPNDPTNTAAPALAWMHVNCGVACHNRNPRSTASYMDVFLKLRVEDVRTDDGGVRSPVGTDSHVSIVGRRSRMPPYDGEGRLIVKAGFPDESLLAFLVKNRGDGQRVQMPPIATHLPDPDGVERIRRWIENLPR